MMFNRSGKGLLMENQSQQSTSIPESIPLQYLEYITNQFSINNKLGSGGFGTVYKVEDENGNVIAVKKLHDMEGTDDKFLYEVKNLMNLNHQNIVQLKRYCCLVDKKVMPYNKSYVLADDAIRLLCFEYMSNGSLDKHVYDISHGLDWNQRYVLIEGICNGLHYLHEGLKDCSIIHLDLKPANILLDKNMMAKITDFGLSRLFGEKKSKTYTENIRGSWGYMPPEYLKKSIISKKSDIYSLGVIMIEIIVGHRKYPDDIVTSSKEFIEDVNEDWMRRLQTTSRNRSLDEFCQQIKICTEIGLQCMESEPEKRTSIVDVINRLNGRENTVYKWPSGTFQTNESNWHGSNDKRSLVEVSEPELSTSRNDKRSLVENITSLVYRIFNLNYQEVTKASSEPELSTDIGPGDTTSKPVKWRIQTIFKKNTSKLKSVDIHPIEPWILFSENSTSINIWNYQTQETVISFKLGYKQGNLAKFFAHMGWLVDDSLDGFIYVYSYKTKRQIKRIQAHNGGITSIVVHPTQPYLLSSYDHEIKLWDWNNGWKCTKKFQGHFKTVWQVRFNPKNPSTFASASMDGTVKIWSLDSPSPILTLEVQSKRLKSVDYCTNDDRSHLITHCSTKTAQVWNHHTKSYVGPLEHENVVNIIFSHPDLPILITSSVDGTVYLWNSTTYRLNNTLNFGLGTVAGIGYLKGSRRVVIAHLSGLVMIEIRDEESSS